MQGSRHIGEPRCRGAETFSHPNGHDVKGLVDRFVDRFMVCFWAMYMLKTRHGTKTNLGAIPDSEYGQSG